MTIPKPSEARRRTNSPADRPLPLSGRDGPPPSPPVPLGHAGNAWWAWAWSTPQACRWHHGFLWPAAKRAELEDLWHSGEHDPVKLLPSVLRLDDALGLTPKAATQQYLRFEQTVEVAETKGGPRPPTDIRSRIRGLSA